MGDHRPCSAIAETGAPCLAAVDAGPERRPSGDNSAEGFLVVEVEPLPAHQRYAMVRQILTADGKLREGFTVPVRHGDQTTYPAAAVRIP